MNLKQKRKEIRKKHFATGGLIIVSILGFIGMLLVFFTGIFNVKNINMLYDCLLHNGVFIIFGVFFFIVSVYVWMLFFFNTIIKPKKEILYLDNKENDKVWFLDKKGKKFIYNKSDIETGCHYYVLKTRDYIYEILEEANENWIPKEKKSYWLNCYSPMGNHESVFLLPVFYVLLLVGLLMLITSTGIEKISGLILCVLSFYEIGYDFVYKIKLKKQNTNIVDDAKFYKSYKILRNSILVFLSIWICVELINLYLKLPDSNFRLIIVLFFIVVIFMAYKNFIKK